MINKKIASELAVAIIAFFAIIVGIFFWQQDEKNQVPSQETAPTQLDVVQVSQFQSDLNQESAVVLDVDQNIEPKKVCPDRDFPQCRSGYVAVPNKKDANGCEVAPTCEPCPEVKFSGCRSGYFVVPSEEPLRGCKPAPTCEPCPEVNFSGCRSGYVPVPNKKDSNGCEKAPTCFPCPEVAFPGCRSGYVAVPNKKDSNGCEVAPTCEPQN
jgi:hypothetical protein